MPRAVVLLALAVLLGAGLLFAWLRGGKREERAEPVVTGATRRAGEDVVREPVPVESPGPAASLAERSPVPPVGEPRETATPPEPPRVELRSLRVLVTDLAGNPIEAARVRLPEYAEAEEDWTEHETGPDGTCTIETDRSDSLISLLVEREGFAHVRSHFEPEGELRIQLPWAITLTGRVLEAGSARPIPGATVAREHVSCRECLRDRALADEEGRYELAGVASGAGLESLFLVDAEGYPRQWYRFEVRTEEGRVVHDFVLEPGIAVAGQVLDLTTRAPIEGARVGQIGKLQTTGPAGRFDARAVQDSGDGRFSLRTYADEHCPVIVSFTREEAAGPFVLFLARSAALEGTVRDPDGKPVVGARVDVSLVWGEHRGEEGVPAASELGFPAGYRFAVDNESRYAHSDRSGRFRVTGLIPHSTLQAFVSCDGYRELRLPRDSAGGPGHTTSLDVALEPIGAVGTIRGRLSLNGEPVEASIQWEGPSGNGYALVQGGRYELQDVEVGIVSLRVLLHDFERPHLVLSGGEVALQVDPGAELTHDFDLRLAMSTVSGRLRHEDGTPGVGLAVWFTDRDGLGGDVRSGADGTYVLEVPDVGAAYVVSVDCSNESHRREGVLAGATGVDFVLPNAGVLRYRVVDAETETTISEHTLWWKQTGKPAFRRAEVGLADERGWREASFPLGPLELLVRADEQGYPYSIVKDLVASPSATSGETIALRRGFAVQFALGPRSGPLPPDHELLLLENEAWEAVWGHPRDDVRVNHIILRLVETFDPQWIEYRTLSFGYSGEASLATLRGLAPGRHGLRVFPDDVVIEPAEIDLTTEPSGPIVITWRAKDR